MRIAMPHLEGKVNPHFGTSREFVVLETENGQITGKKIITNEVMHNHGGLALMLRAEEADVIITGGIGGPMANALQMAGFEVITGVVGDVEQVAAAYLSGNLVSGKVSCNCGGHHGHGHER